MRKTMTVIWMLLVTGSILFFSGCGKRTDLVVAKVGDKKITVADLYQAAQKLPFRERQKIRGPERWRKCLSLLIDKELLVLEAKNRGLDKSEKVVEAVREKKRRLLLDKLYEVEVKNKARVTDAQAREYFEQNGLNERIRISQIVVRTEDEAKRILNELHSGRDFAELARQNSIEKYSAQRGGDMGWFIRGQLPPEIEKVAFSLKVGQVSQPVKFHSNYRLLKLTDKKKIRFTDIKDSIKKKLLPQALIARRKEHSNSVKEEAHLRYQAQGLKVFLDKQRELNQKFPELSTQEGRTVLYRFDGGEMTLADFVKAVRKMCSICRYPAIGDSAAWKKVADQAVLEFALLPRAARQLGLDKDKDVLAQLEQSKEEFMAMRLRELEVLNKITITEPQAREYFNTHRNDYMVPPRAQVIDILLKDKEQAARILKQIQQGADMEKLAEKYSTLKRPGVLRWKFPMFNTERSEDIFGKRFVEAVFKAEPGKVVGPLKVKGGYAVFKVLKKEPPRQKDFSEVKKGVIEALHRKEENQLLDRLLKNLRKKYSSRIAVYENILKELT